MKFKPLRDGVAIQACEQETKTAGGIIIPDSAKEQPMQGKVVAIGSGIFVDGKLTPLDVKIGDNVLYGKWSGNEIKIDGKKILFMKESDILGIIDQ